MHALSVSLLRAKQLPVITNGLGASPHAGSTCTIGVVTVRPLNRLPARLYFKLKPDPNNTFFFIFTCTTQYPWVLANLNLSQAMAPSKKKRTHTVFRDSSAHRSASTSKPRFVEECGRVKLNEICSKGKSSLRQKDVFNDGPYIVYGASGVIGTTSDYQNEIPYVAIVKDGAGVGRANACEPMTSVLGTMQALIPNPNVERDYLLHLVRSLRLGEGFSGSTIPHIYFKDYGRIEVPLPPLGAQKRIVSQLGLVEAQITQAEAQIEQLDRLVKSRFVEMFGSSSADSRYEVCRIGDIADVFVGVVIKPKQYYTDDHANGIKAFRSLNVGEMHVRDDDWVYFSKEGNKKAKKTQLHAGDVLVVRSGYPGTSCVVPLLYEGCNAVDLIIARSNSNNVLPEYIAAFNNGSHMKSLINQMSVGSAQKHFNIGFYRNVEIPLPPLSAQKEYVSFLRQVDKSRFVRDHEINFR